MKHTPMIILSAILELLRIVVLALLARFLLADTHHALSVFLMRVLVAGNFVFPALLFLIWLNTEYAHYMYIFVPLKIALLLTELSGIPMLFSYTTQQLLAGNRLTIIGGIIIVIICDSIILFTAAKALQQLKKPQAEPPVIETVELS